VKSLYLIDAIGPFFRGWDRRKVNWSKLPWARLNALSDEEQSQFYSQVREDMSTFVERVSIDGFTAVSLDDVAHLADHEAYDPAIRSQIRQYGHEFHKVFSIVKEEGLDLFLTMDILSLAPGLKDYLCIGSRSGKFRERRVNDFLVELIDRFLSDFPEVSGLILRIGESDGRDIKEDFRSELYLTTPSMVNRFLRSILPIFEKHNKLCIFRTWTVGAHSVGDLIWRHATLKQVLRRVESQSLILSMKYGESDFFRYLTLNRNFFLTELPTIIELQARREYEGCGEYPSFVGWDYQNYALELAQAPNCIGISVWCQTGGWTPFRRLAYLEKSAIWTEINAWVSLRIFRFGDSVEAAIISHPLCKGDKSAWIELLRLSDEAVKELLYLKDYASQSFYFRRVRIPPLLGTFWHNIFVSETLSEVLMHFVEDPDHCIRTGYGVIEKIRKMKELAVRCELPVKDIEYMEDTFSILALAREYHLGGVKDRELIKKLKKAKKRYKRKYPKGTRYRYAIKLHLEPIHFGKRHISWFFRYIVRGKMQYRFVDRLIEIRLLSLGWWLLKRTRPKAIPKFARKSAMGIDTIFR